MAVVLSLCALAACGSADAGSGRAPALDWWIGPDRADPMALARTCTAASGGDYSIRVRQLPADVGERHTMLVRRLAVKDMSIDLLSLDSAFTSEFSAARYLAPVPDDLAVAYSTGVAPAALAAATYEGQLAVVPWWFDPQLLWYRGNVAERAGLDTTGPVSWEDLIVGAERLGVTVQIDDVDGSGLGAWVSGLTAAAGGEVVKGAGRGAKAGLDTDAGRSAALIVELYHESGLGPGPSRGALKAFTAPDGGFLVAPSSVITDPALASVAADMGWTTYPAVGLTSIAPLAGVGLAVPLYAPESDLSFRAITCLTSPTALAGLMVDSGHSASRLTTYDDPSVTSGFPMAAVTKAAVLSGRAVPATPYWNVVRNAIDETWTPLRDVAQDSTPPASQKAVLAALEGRLP